MMMKKKILIGALCLLVLLVILAGVSAYRSSTELTVVQYELPAALSEPIRIVHLTDLHGRTFGGDNAELVQLVAEQKPELILMTGDMMDRSNADASVVCGLIRNLTEVAPVYFGYGNHEYQWMKNHGESLTGDLTEAGALVLDVSWLDITLKGQDLRLGGYHGYYRQPHMFQVTAEEKAAQLAFCEEFEQTDRYKILLNHIPTAWLDWGYIDKFPVDLVLSGHYHGGQIRLPLLGGVYAPYIGLFPEYTEGLFTGTQASCVLSTGLGYAPGLPRINNLPQITVVDLVPADHS